MIDSYALERALKRAHSGFWILRLEDRPTFPARIHWYNNEICACPKGEIFMKTISNPREGIISRGLKDILGILKANAYKGYDYRKVEKMVNKLC